MKIFLRWFALLMLLTGLTSCSPAPYDVVMPLLETVSAFQQASPTLTPFPTQTIPATSLPLILTPTHTPSPSPSLPPLPTNTSTALPGTAQVTLINHTPYTVYVELHGYLTASYALSAASRVEFQAPPGEYRFRWLISGSQQVRGTVTFPAGAFTWEIYDTPGLVESPTPMWTVSP